MRTAVILLGILLAGFSSHAQKIKYKDLYILLRAKNYEEASGFLVKFLSQEPDHPNANYQMGLMLEYKLKELDLLKETDSIIAQADSAIVYFNKAHDLIDDKDIRKHDDDYYELFKRRNLRTGKFEVILSDVQLDIEERVKSLNAIKNQVGKVKGLFDKSISFYKSATSTYEKLRQDYGDEITFSLGAKDSDVISLKEMAVEYDSAVASFKAYKKIRKTFEGDAYHDVLIDVKPIEAFSKQALEHPDFYANKVNFYNFSSWSSRIQMQIEELKEFVNGLTTFDESLNKLAIQIVADSADLSSEIFTKITSPVLKDLKQIDPESWLITLFQYKISQLNLSSAWMGWYGNYADTLDVGVQLDYAKKIQNQVDGVSKIEKTLRNLDKTSLMLKYHGFVDANYSNIEGLAKYVEDQKGIVEQDSKEISELITAIQNKDKWGWWHQDSISLGVSNDTFSYITMYSDSLVNRRVAVAGIHLNEDAALLYFGSVPSSRKIDTLYQVAIPRELNKENVITSKFDVKKTSNLEYVLLLSTADNTPATFLGVANATEGIKWLEKVEGVSLPAELNVEGEHIQIMQEDSEPIVYGFDGKKVEGQ